MGEEVRGPAPGTGLPAGRGPGLPVERWSRSLYQRHSGQRRVWRLRGSRAFPARSGRAGQGGRARGARGARFVQPCLERQLVPFQFRVLFQTQYIPFFSSSCHWRTETLLWGRDFAGWQVLTALALVGGAARPPQRSSSLPPSRPVLRPLRPWVSSDFFVFSNSMSMNLHFI